MQRHTCLRWERQTLASRRRSVAGQRRPGLSTTRCGGFWPCLNYLSTWTTRCGSLWPQLLMYIGIPQGKARRAQRGQALLQDRWQDGFQQGDYWDTDDIDYRLRWWLERPFSTQVKEELGFGQTHSFFSAAAPISRDVLEYFMSLDIKVGASFTKTLS